MNMQRLYLVDASVYVFRAYHALEPNWHDEEGWATHAVHGYASFLLQLLEQLQPTEGMAVCFDEALDSSFRNQIYSPYKANRDPADEGLLRQFRHCQDFTRALGVATLADPIYEADDRPSSVFSWSDGIYVGSPQEWAQLLAAYREEWDACAP